MEIKQEHTTTIEGFHLRMPSDLKTAITQIADDEKRSLNAQIVLVLESFVKSRASREIALT